MTGGPFVTINSLKYDKSVRKSWSATLLEHSAERLIFEGIFHREVDHPDLGRIESGTISIEYFWLDKWYSIFQFLGPDRKLRNYYCNVNMPPIYSGSTLNYVDLDLDIVVWPDSSYTVLDAAEFEENAKSFAYPEPVKEGAIRALDELLLLIRNGSLPGRQF